jgi:hypothetical protein
MSRLLQIGPRGYQHAVAAASLSFTPYYDRAARVTSVKITKPSAQDQWVLTVSGKEITRFEVDTVGNQQLTGNPTPNVAATGSKTQPQNRDLFSWSEEAINEQICYPVPNGQPFSLASAAGATADILIEFEECTKDDIKVHEINHFQGSKFRLPVWGYLSTSIADNNEHLLDTQISPSWVPSIFNGVRIQAGYTVDIHALFIEGGGQNAFAAATDHLSTTDHIGWVVNGQQLFTRLPYTVPALAATSGQGSSGATQATRDGIPCVGEAAAAGSVNNVYGDNLYRFPAFQAFRHDAEPVIDPGIRLKQGATSSFSWALNGDPGAGASYAHNMVVALVDVTVEGGI